MTQGSFGRSDSEAVKVTAGPHPRGGHRPLDQLELLQQTVDVVEFLPRPLLLRPPPP
jgi:hypothetical protein